MWAFPADLPWLVAVLLAAGFFITLRLAFIQFRQLGHAIKVVAGKYDDPDDPGDVNHFQALSTALSATVGIGNIAGVATAIHYGGPGAVFWMWVTA
ncbi:MAG: alanine:cation symporter family protein, partial [Myxococcota bacterium]